jgi:hypothetical protein
MNTLNLGTTNQTPNLEDQRTLEDRELDAVTGGRILTKHPAAVTIPELKVTLGS